MSQPAVSIAANLGTLTEKEAKAALKYSKERLASMGYPEVEVSDKSGEPIQLNVTVKPEVVALLAQLKDDLGLTKGQIVTDALKMYADPTMQGPHLREQHGPTDR